VDATKKRSVFEETHKVKRRIYIVKKEVISNWQLAKDQGMRARALCVYWDFALPG
jgi:hypothetical protein